MHEYSCTRSARFARCHSPVSHVTKILVSENSGTHVEGGYRVCISKRLLSSLPSAWHKHASSPGYGHRWPAWLEITPFSHSARLEHAALFLLYQITSCMCQKVFSSLCLTFSKNLLKLEKSPKIPKYCCTSYNMSYMCIRRRLL